MSKKINDSGYKKLFSNKTIFRELIETFVNEEWVKEIDFNSCETIDKSFISEHYKETESDLLYRLQLKGKEVYVYVLMEFQSSVDCFMSLRVLNYLTNFYMDYLLSNRSVKRLPAVFPIVLYNGDKEWRATTNIADLIEGNELLGEFALHFKYFKIAENEYSKEKLLKIHNIVSTLFLSESYYDVGLLEEELLNLFDRESDKDALSLFLNWFKQLSVHGKIEKEDYKQLETVYKNKEEVKTMLIKALEKEKKEIFEKGKIEGKVEGKAKGKAEGKAEGRMEGRIEGKIETAKRMLSKGMEVYLISEITGLSENEISKIKENR